MSHLSARVLAGLCVSAVVVSLAPVSAAAATSAPASSGTSASPASVRHAFSPARPPQLPRGTKALGSTSSTQRLSLDFVLQPSDPAGLAALATAVNTPGNAEFHHFLAAGQFAKRYGATASEVASVKAFLTAQGLTPGAVQDGLSIPVKTTVASASAALATGFASYQLPSGRHAFANTATPTLPDDVAGALQAVVGLNDIAVPVPASGTPVPPPALPARPKATSGGTATTDLVPAVTATGPQPCTSASAVRSSYPGTWTADQLATAYRISDLFGQGYTGSGVHVGLIELEPFSSSDISAYQSCYGLSNPLATESIAGGATGTSSGEAALDIETVMSAAPGASLTVYSAPNLNALDAYRQMAADDTATVLQSSWGTCEATDGYLAAENTVFAQMAVQGQDLYAASGDTGSEGCERPNGSTILNAGSPASSPWVTGVGGTTLNAIGPAPSETTWNAGGGAGGGGLSVQWAMPSYQSGPGVVSSYSSSSVCATATNSAASDCRETPDVSADADPDTGYAYYFSGAWSAIGGTSAASPEWAGMMADIGQSCSAGFVNPALYAIAGDSSLTPAFNDVTTGNDDLNNVHNGSYPATAGYDMATGLGSPIATGLLADLCHTAAAPTSVHAAAGNGQASVTFTAPAEGGPYTVTATDVTTPAHGGETATTSSTAAVVTGLTDGDRYTFSVTSTAVANAVPSAPTSTVTPTTSALGSGQSISAGQAVLSPSGAYELLMRADGALVDLQVAGQKLLWTSGTTTGAKAVLQTDGSFVVKDANGTVVFTAPGTAGSVGDGLVVGNDGQVEVDAASGTVAWSPALALSTPAGSFGTQATLVTGLSSPYGIGADATGDVFVADYANSRIVEEPAGGGSLVTVYSNPGSAFAPLAVAVDRTGNVYVADYGSGSILKLDTYGRMTTVASGFNQPRGVAVDRLGNVYVADAGNSNVVEVPAGTSTKKVLLASPAVAQPYGVAVDNAGDLFVADTYDYRVLELAAGATSTTVLPFSNVGYPTGIAADGAGDVFINNSGYGSGIVQELPARASTDQVLGFSGLADPTYGVAVDRVGDVSALDSKNSRVVELPFTPASVPGAPTIGTATAHDSSATVSFTAPSSNGGSPITGYTVTSTPGSVTASGTASPITVTGLTNGQSYTFTVTATNTIGTGAASAASSSVTPAGVPGPVTGVSATAGDGSATVHWTAPASNGSAITSYVITPSAGSAVTVNDGTATSGTVNGLVNGTSYTFTVKAVNGVGSGAASAASSPVVPAGKPLPPTTVSASAGHGQATVTFSGATANGASITGYTVTSSPGNVTTTGAGSPITVSGLTNGTPYTFTVQATNSVGTGSPSSASNAVTPTGGPGAPTITSVTAGDGSAQVGFSTPANNGSSISSYTVMSSPGGLTASGSSSPLTVIGLTDGTTYTFTVTATNAVGTGAPSAASTAVTPLGKPGAPSAVSAARGDQGAVVTFTAPANNGSAITSYRVTSSPGGVTADGSGSPVTVLGLTNGTLYTFTVTATNAVGTGAASSPSNSVTPAGVPAQVTGVSATRGDSSVSLTWTPPSANGSALQSYLVAWSGGSQVFQSPAATGAVITGLTNGTAYSFTVAATNGVGTGPASAATSSVTPAGYAAAPTGVSATAGDQSATVGFTPPASNNGSPISGYTVTAMPGGITATGTTSPVQVTGLTNGTTYTFTVATTNGVGTGSSSAASAPVTPAGFPAAPTGVSAQRGDRSAVVSFTPPTDGNGSPIDHYTVTSSPDSIQQTGSGSPITVTGLTNGTAYTFTVTATNGVGTSQASSPSAPVTPVATPTPPTSVTAVAGDGQATVTFSGAADNGSPITGYTVTSSPGAVTATGTTSPITVTGLTDGTSYTFTVAATSSVGTGLASSPSQAVTPLGRPAPPTAVAATPGDGQASVAFTPGSDNGSAITSYAVTSSPGGIVTSGSASPIVVTGLDNGTNYTFTVTATNDLGTSDASAPSVAATPAGLPGQVTDVVATAHDGSASLTWTSPDGNGSPVSSYVVSWNGSHVNVAGPSSAVVNGLVNGQSYAFTVAAVNGVGTGSGSTPSNSVTPAGLPAAPTDVAAGRGDGSALVSFTPPADDNGSAVTGYTVTASPGGAMASGTTSPIEVTGLTNGTSYTFTVTTTNGVGTGSPSATSAPVVPAGLAAAPTAVSAVRGDHSAIVSFTPPADGNGAAITGYVVTVTPGGAQQAGTGSPITVTGLTNGTAYTFTVATTNAVGTGADSVASTSVTPAGVPAAPTAVVAQVSDSSATVSFVPGDSNGATATGYTVTASPGGLTQTGSGSPITVSGLTDGTAYTFTVVASNAVGDSASSLPSTSVTPVGKPSPPTSGSAVAGKGGTAVVSFSGARANGLPITGYTVTAQPGGAQANGTSSPITISGLTNGVWYTFTVTATNALGAGKASSPSNGILADGAAPVVKVTAPTALGIGTSVTLSYAATDSASGVSSYSVRYRVATPTGTFGSYVTKLAGSTAKSVTVAETVGDTYCFDVMATDKAGNASAWTGDVCTARALDASHLVASSGWSKVSSSKYYDGIALSSVKSGATLTVAKAQVKRISLVATKCAGCGSVGVYLGSTLVKTISLSSSTTAYRQVIAVTVFTAVKSGTLVVKNLSTKPVRVEGLAVSRA